MERFSSKEKTTLRTCGDKEATSLSCPMKNSYPIAAENRRVNNMNTENAVVRQTKSKKKPILRNIVVVVIIVFVAILIVMPIFVLSMFVGKRYEQEQFNSIDNGISSERITLTTDDDISLAAWRTYADESKGTIIILSGIQNPSVTAFFGYAKMFADNGWDSLLIEMRARSESEGDEIGLGMTEWRDAKAGVDFLSSETSVKDLPIVLMGTSMGGTTVITAAGELPAVDAVISASAYSSFTSMAVTVMPNVGIPKAIAIVDLPFLNLVTGFYYGFDKLKYSAINGIAKLEERPILLMHSTEDTQVPFSEFEKLLNEADKNNINVTTFIREGDEHIICYEQYIFNPAEDAEFARAVLGFLNDNF